MAEVKIPGDGRPVLLGDGLDYIAQPGVLADGDGEADVHLAAGRHQSVSIEAAVGAHSELSRCSGVAHSAHGLPQEVGRAASGVGSALTEPNHQHVASVRGDGQQWVIAPLAGVTMVAGPFLAQSVGLANGGVQADG